MLEVEMKFRAADLAAVTARLVSLGAVRDADRRDEDHYFNAPDRDFKQTDEAFRLRRIGAENRLTYKGPRIDAATKTRKEIEIRLADGDATAADTERMLVSLGYRSTAVVHKRRKVYHLERPPFAVEACADEVDRVGLFVELEIVAEESRLAEAKAVLFALADELGLQDHERRSYLEMLLTAPNA